MTVSEKPALRTDVPSDRPYYRPIADEIEIFRAAYASKQAILLKGPTGCGKTRFVEAMAFDLGRPLTTVVCHEDLGAPDLVGRHLLQGTETVWQDGPLTRSVRRGGICYLDEIVEARADALVVVHPLTDHRRMLPIDRLDEVVIAPPEFGLVASYNPGYQSALKDLKPSTRQRMAAIEFDYPSTEVELEILTTESSTDGATAEKLVALAGAIRRQDDLALREVASTRTLVATAKLLAEGVRPLSAVRAAMIQPLTDDRSAQTGLMEIVRAVFGDEP